MSMHGALAALALLVLLSPVRAYASDTDGHSDGATASSSLAAIDLPSGIRTIRVQGTDCNITVPDNMQGVQEIKASAARASDAQIFELIPAGRGVCKIRTRASGGYLAESGDEPRSSVQQRGSGTYRESNALWIPVRTEGGVGFRNRESGLMMTVADDHRLVVDDYDQDALQSFRLDDIALTIEDGWYFIQTPVGRVLGIDDGIIVEGQSASLQPRGASSWNSKSQRFFLQGRGDDTFEIVTCDPTYAIDITLPTRETRGNLHVAERSDSGTQSYRLHIGDNGYYEIENADSGRYLDVNDCSSRDSSCIHQCEANHSAAQQFRFLPTNRPSTKGEDIAHAAVKLACEVDGRLDANDPSERIYTAATQRYVDARERLMDPVGTEWENPPGEYASCDVGVATAVRYSRADVEFEYRTLINQWPYLEEHFECVGTYVYGGDSSLLEPGDILISEEHIAIWVGNEIVRERFPKSAANLYEAGYNPSYYPSLIRAEDPDDSDFGVEFTVFRIRE